MRVHPFFIEREDDGGLCRFLLHGSLKEGSIHICDTAN